MILIAKKSPASGLFLRLSLTSFDVVNEKLFEHHPLVTVFNLAFAGGLG